MWCVKIIFKDLRSDCLSVTNIFVPEQYGIMCGTSSQILDTRWLWVIFHIPAPLATEKKSEIYISQEAGWNLDPVWKLWWRKCLICFICWDSNAVSSFIPLAPEFFLILAHPVCKLWILQEPKKVTLWNKRHFEEKNGECAACLKYSVRIFID
jgi:hypothetical protein